MPVGVVVEVTGSFDQAARIDYQSRECVQVDGVYWSLGEEVSPGSLMIYSGDAFPDWTGDAFIGALSGQALIRVGLDGANATNRRRRRGSLCLPIGDRYSQLPHITTYQ